MYAFRKHLEMDVPHIDGSYDQSKYHGTFPDWCHYCVYDKIIRIDRMTIYEVTFIVQR